MRINAASAGVRTHQPGISTLVLIGTDDVQPGSRLPIADLSTRHA
jgi:hypothetical protein